MVRRLALNLVLMGALCRSTRPGENPRRSNDAKWRYTSMDYRKTVVTPVLMHWSYHSLALSHRLNRNLVWCLIRYRHFQYSLRTPHLTSQAVTVIGLTKQPRKAPPSVHNQWGQLGICSNRFTYNIHWNVTVTYPHYDEIFSKGWLHRVLSFGPLMV